MMPERLTREQEFHDRQAEQRSRTWATDPRALYFDEETYFDHETWIRPALARLGDIAGKRILDLGCGHGMMALALARRGAKVTALELSRGYLREARLRARHNETSVAFVQANGEYLPFADGIFGAVWGNAVLHHLDLERAAGELQRVLTPRGIAVFCEPWGENPLLSWARRRLPYAGKHRTADEEPLTLSKLEPLRRRFPALQVQGVQFLSMARRVLNMHLARNGLDWCDERLLSRFPSLQRWCRYVILTLRR